MDGQGTGGAVRAVEQERGDLRRAARRTPGDTGLSRGPVSRGGDRPAGDEDLAGVSRGVPEVSGVLAGAGREEPARDRVDEQLGRSSDPDAAAAAYEPDRRRRNDR